MTADIQLRSARDSDEVRTTLDVIGADFTVPFDHTDLRVQQLAARALEAQGRSRGRCGRRRGTGRTTRDG
jgi:hypothetical protein